MTAAADPAHDADKREPLGRAEDVRRLRPDPRRPLEAITHLAFYAGRPKAMSAMTVAKQVFRSA